MSAHGDMSKVVFLLVAFTMLSLYGCKPDSVLSTPGYEKRSGDLCKFFIEKASVYGGHSKTNAAPFEINTIWSYKADTNGFQILIDSASNEAFQKFLFATFDGGTINSNYPNVLFKVRDAGVAIMGDLGTNTSHIIVIRSGAF